nr:DUF5658 family protein [Candidatus Freyarchaeota archaeon]
MLRQEEEEASEKRVSYLTTIFSAIFVMLNTTDLFFTRIGLARGLNELNPIANIAFNMGLGDILKISCTVIALLCIYCLQILQYPLLACFLSGSLTLFVLIVVIWNILQFQIGG